jgi:hypothetical protein
MLKKLAAAALMTAAVFGAPAPASAQTAGIKIGMLVCNMAGGAGYIVGSNKLMTCTYYPAAGGPNEHYLGSISRLGVDIGFTTMGQLWWVVFAPTVNVGPGSLAGTYVGAGASATVGVGLGANALVGGFQQSMNLQPVSVQGNLGLQVAAGGASIGLQFWY